MTYVDTWDSGQKGADWDSGLQWDINVGPAPGDIAQYLRLITSEHNDKPDFVSTVSALVQPMADLLVLYASLTPRYDLDTAVGAQLDVVGQWIGVSRVLTVALANPFFSWDEVGLGWDEGSWWSPDNPLTELIVLPDDAYRTLLRARAANNQWDGTIPGAYAIWNILFAGTGRTIDITDNEDMTMVFTLRGTPPDAITLALLNDGLLSLRPAGVLATVNYVP